MPLCHPAPNQINQNVSFQPILNFMTNIKETGINDRSFEQIEAQIRCLMNQLESSLLGECLKQFDIQTRLIVKGDQQYRHVLREEKTYNTCAGPVRVERSLYRGPDGDNICPLELQAGIIEGSWTPSAARMGYYVTALLSPYQGEKLFKKLDRATPSKSALDRLSRQIGHQWEANHDGFFSELSEQITVPSGAVSMSASFDGIMLPMKTKPQKAKDEKKTYYKEAACAAVCFYDQTGQRLSTLRFGRMPEAKKATLKNELSQTVENILHQKPNLTLVKVADGARDNWRYLGDTLRPGEGVEILDFYHASEHLNKAIEAAYGKNSITGKSHYEKYRSILKHDEIGAERVIRTLTYFHKKHPKRKQILTELNYFKNNLARMNYADLAKNNLPIGSGVTEASCKTLVTQRMKCSGMRWDIAGGQGVLTARSLIQSERFDEGWNLLSASYKEKVELPKNVVLFGRK
jgi:phenylpyruvate tautomerase PptA (4-oxalocrotonate tautomerase family)